MPKGRASHRPISAGGRKSLVAQRPRKEAPPGCFPDGCCSKNISKSGLKLELFLQGIHSTWPNLLLAPLLLIISHVAHISTQSGELLCGCCKCVPAFEVWHNSGHWTNRLITPNWTSSFAYNQPAGKEDHLVVLIQFFLCAKWNLEGDWLICNR